jgi:hypothetical protein
MMDECICSNCNHLKGVIGENGEVGEYTCKYGFPSEECGECEGSSCDITCQHFAEDEEDRLSTVKCSKCGKDLSKVAGDDAEGEVYCMECYLNNMN